MKLSSVLTLAASAAVALAKTVTYDFEVDWVNANPDGLSDRKVIGINGGWPLPRIEVTKGDRVIVNLKNNLETERASIHFHGIYMNGSSHMDGPVSSNQCGVPPGSTFVYNFTVDLNVGTYWYHTHVDGQYPDGYRGPLIVQDPDAYFKDLYDEELVVTLSDWYHELVEDLSPSFLNVYNPTGAEPVPKAMLFNDTQKSAFSVKPNTTYLLRLINIGAFSAQYFYIEDHDFQIVEVDGIYTEPQNASHIYIAAAQRYAVLLTTKDTTAKNYPIVTVFDWNLFDVIDPSLQLNLTNWLEYDSSAALPEADLSAFSTSDDIMPLVFDDFDLVPHDKMPLLEPDHTIELTLAMNNLGNGINYAFFNNITYTMPKVPTLYTALQAGDLAFNPAIYSEYTNPFVLKHNEVVEIVINNADSGTHPLHLHGHAFQVVVRDVDYSDAATNVVFDPANATYPATPMRRDVSYVRAQSNMVLRFRADNPGVWLFHCHIEWHMMQGLAVTFIEAPDVLQKTLTIPDNHIEACKAANLPYLGNAAANNKDFLNLAGQNEQFKPLPAGFTARGIVALVFSCISAFLGMAAIGWYGLSDLTVSSAKFFEHETGEHYQDEVDDSSSGGVLEPVEHPEHEQPSQH